MAKRSLQLLTLPDGKFTCSCCARCCYDWHVELLPEEVKTVSTLPWPADDEMCGRGATLQHGGRTYLAKRSDGSCVFLNRTNGLCRIHDQFGMDSKPLGCKLYPFQIMPLTPDTASVTARFDCPRVRANVGQPHVEAVPELRGYLPELVLPEPVDERSLRPFNLEQVQTISEFVGILLSGFAGGRARALFMIALSDQLESNPASGFDRTDLARQFPVIREQIQADVSDRTFRPNLLTRIVFRTYLGLYLRRDEDVVNGFASRPARLLGMMKLTIGFGRLSQLGRSHPRVPIRSAKLFRSSVSTDANVFDPFWRMVQDKLASLQFIGTFNPGHGVIDGLRSLALLYPLVRATAQINAADRGGESGTAEDVDRAIGMIGHAFGRSPILAQPSVRSLEKFLRRSAIFQTLL